MCFRKRNEPVRLNKKESREIIISTEAWIMLAFIVIFIVAIVIAWMSRSYYFYNMELV